jgi:hypothetical protein
MLLFITGRMTIGKLSGWVYPVGNDVEGIANETTL